MEQKNQQTSCLIQGHQSKSILALCSNGKCKDPKLLCVKCIAFSHKECSNHIILFEDLLNKDYSQFIEQPCYKLLKDTIESLNKKEPAKSDSHSDQQLLSEFTKLVDQEFNFIKASFEEYLNNLKLKLQENLKKILAEMKDNIADVNNSIRCLVEADELTSFLQEISSEKDYMSDEKTGKINRYCEQYWDRHSAIVSSLKGAPNLSSLSVLMKLKKNSLTIRKIYQELETNLSLEKLSKALLNDSKPFSFLDSSRKHDDIALSENNTIATKRTSTSHAIAFGEALTSGVHKWEVMPSGITAKNGDWVQFGIFNKDENSSSKFQFAKCYGLTSGGYYNAHMVQMTNVSGETYNFNNKTFLCEYDADKGTLTITGDNIKAEAKNLKGTFYPFVNLYHIGNTVKVRVL